MKTAKLFGLVLVLGMMFLLVQYRLRRPALSKITHVIHQVQRQTEVLMAERRDPHRIFCPPSPSKRRGLSDTLDDTNGASVRNVSVNNTSKVSEHLDNDRDFNKENENNNIVFITGHRAGGSTVQNVLLRFAMTRNLNVLLPTGNDVYINETHAHVNKSQIVPAPQGQKYNILCHQFVYNKKVLTDLFPKSTFHIGILSHPLNQSASAFYFYAHRQKSSKEEHNAKYSMALKADERNPYRSFINSPSEYDVETPNHSFTNNRQSIDLGFPVTSSFESDKNDNSKVSKFIGEVDKQFDLIMIAEMIDESLILLRRLLHWRMENILYTKLSLSNTPDHTSNIEKLSEDDKKQHKKWETIDYALYGNFKSKLEGLILAQGEGFQQELIKFREIQQKVKTFCRRIKISFRSLQLRIDPTPWGPAFCLTTNFCDVIAKDGNQLTNLVRRHQLENAKILSSM